MVKLVSQRHDMGCGIACVASVACINYRSALKFFSEKYADTRGYYCRDVTRALKRSGFAYSHGKVTPSTRKYLRREGTIVFVRRSRRYPSGHYLVKSDCGWMNPWKNYPSLPVKAGFDKRLPGKAQWVIFRV
jgi:hypothetical protein